MSVKNSYNGFADAQHLTFSDLKNIYMMLRITVEWIINLFYNVLTTLPGYKIFIFSMFQKQEVFCIATWPIDHQVYIPQI